MNMTKFTFVPVFLVVFLTANLFFGNYVLAVGPFFQQQKLTASDGAASDLFGVSSSMSPDGTRLAVGAYGINSNTGAVYVFSRSGTTWTQEQKLTASDGVASDYFGNSVSFSSDGTRLVVGAAGFNSFQGAAYVFSRSGTTWTQEQKLTASDGVAGDFLGQVSMSPDGTRLAAGASSWGPSGSNNSQGAVYVFSRSGTTWTQEQEIIASDGVASDFFGNDISLSSSSTRLTIGADGVSGNTGAVYVFSRSGTTWTQEQKLTASDGVALDNFGIRVSISSDSTRLIAGASGWGPSGSSNNQGAAYIFSRSGTTWTQEQEITASDGVAGDFLASATVSMNSDGSRIATSATGASSFQGAAYIFSRSGIAWTQEQKLSASDGAAGHFFGVVSMSSDGTRVVAGAAGINSSTGAAYVFNIPPTVPVLITSSASLIAQTTATLNGNMTANGGEDATERGFNYGLSTSYGTDVTQSSGPYGIGTFAADLTGLDCGTTYYFRSFAANSAGTGQSTGDTFTTADCTRHGSTSSSSFHSVPTGIPSIPATINVCNVGDKLNSRTNPPCISSPTAPVSEPHVTLCSVTVSLKFGSVGNQVKCLQTILKITPDSVFGQKTKAAVILFQKNKHLIPDGIVGAKTRAMLGKN
jgi:hypothetical protein